jgi:hypothetical protein
VAESIKITDQAINNYKTQKKWPAVTLFKLAVEHGLSLDWLLTGEGPMRRDEKREMPAVNEQTHVYTSTAEKHVDVFTQVREILESGDDFVIKALRDRLKDYRLAVAMNAERRGLKQRLTLLEQEVSAIKKSSSKYSGEKAG